MKKILMICLAVVMGAGMCMAAGKPAQKKGVTTVFVLSLIHISEPTRPY